MVKETLAPQKLQMDPNDGNKEKKKKGRKCRRWLRIVRFHCAIGCKRHLKSESKDHSKRQELAESFCRILKKQKSVVPLDDSPKSTVDLDRSPEVLATKTTRKKGRRKFQFSCNIFPKGNCFTFSGSREEIDEGGTHQAEEMETIIGSTSTTQVPLTPVAEERCIAPTAPEASEEEGDMRTPQSGGGSRACLWNPISTCLTNCMSPRCTIGNNPDGLVGISTLAIALLAMLAGGRSLAIACTSVWFYLLPTLRGRTNY